MVKWWEQFGQKIQVISSAKKNNQKPTYCSIEFRIGTHDAGDASGKKRPTDSGQRVVRIFSNQFEGVNTTAAKNSEC